MFYLLFFFFSDGKRNKKRSKRKRKAKWNRINSVSLFCVIVFAALFIYTYFTAHIKAGLLLMGRPGAFLTTNTPYLITNRGAVFFYIP